MEIPEDYDIFFLGGGATLQFAMIPMNFLRPDTVADNIKSGAWANKAVSDAKKIGNVHLYYDGTDTNFTSLPDPKTVRPSENSSYLYVWNRFCPNMMSKGKRYISRYAGYQPF